MASLVGWLSLPSGIHGIAGCVFKYFRKADTISIGPILCQKLSKLDSKPKIASLGVALRLASIKNPK
jgi:hypothetical protein